MQRKLKFRPVLELFAGSPYQAFAIFFCVLFGLAMIVNTQLEGEGFWFWYADLFHRGAKLYGDLHLPLQPMMILEMDTWIQVFGTNCLVTEIPSALHVLFFSMALFLILRESDWPDWQKAIVLASAFLISVDCVAYRFDDFHVVMDTFTFYSVALLLLMAKRDDVRRQFALAAGLGILSGLALTTRLNDGGALLVASGICLLCLVREKRVRSVGLFFLAAAMTAACIVGLTGDSFFAYATNSILKAADAKGGAGSILTAPGWLFLAAIYNICRLWWLIPWVVGILAASALLQRRWEIRPQYLVILQLGIAGLIYGVSARFQQKLRLEAFLLLAAYSAIFANYLLIPVVARHFCISNRKDGDREWNPREILILIPLAELASFATSNTGRIATFLSPVALLLLLAAVVHPFRRNVTWAHASLVTIIALMGVCAMVKKIQHPYDWLYYQASPMFEKRQWYRHPIYGPMYMEKDDLRFILPICAEIGQGKTKTELLSMPFSYPNYFCGIPPWHGYVQTFYDTVTQPTVDRLMGEFRTFPPQWIVYQRQMRFLRQAEETYHGGQRLPQRDLDELMMQKIATGQWQVVQREDYGLGEGWYVVRTRP